MAVGLDNEPFPEFEHLLIKLFGLEEFVRQRDKVEVEKGLDRCLLESGGFREAVPESVQVGREGRAEVGEWGGANVVPDDEQEERLVLRAVCGGGWSENGPGRRMRKRLTSWRGLFALRRGRGRG